MKDFLAENNACGQTILALVSRGNAIIAELFRLKNYIPKVYRLETKQDLQEYSEIILDFSYLKTADIQERKIEDNEALRQLDAQLRDGHIQIVKRFYLLFESIHSYIVDLNHYVEELQEGLYIQQSLETVFQDVEGKQLLCEALFLYGLMLYTIDYHIDGPIRERLLVSYNRYTPQRTNTESSFDEVCNLLMDTAQNGKKPLNYPEDLFKRVPPNSNFVDLVVGCLRSDDIYSQVRVYPAPRHRSAALATQSSMLYICLFFSPSLLHLEATIMREIVDKYFSDNWMVSLYMGFIVNLADAWDNFKAAKSALANTLLPANIKTNAIHHGQKVPELLEATSNIFKILLKEGQITIDSLLKEINNVVTILRNCNVTLRWLILHINIKPGTTDKSKRLKQLRESVYNEANCNHSFIINLLLKTSHLERVTKDLYKEAMEKKDELYVNLKTQIHANLLELSEVFSGAVPLSRIPKNSDLQRWLKEQIAVRVDRLELTEKNSAGIIAQLIQALEEVQDNHQLSNYMLVVQYLSDIRNDMQKMIRLSQVKEDVFINLQIIGDISYAWELIDFYTHAMQEGIKRDPGSVNKVRPIFLKLASVLELPLLRINQAQSEDLISVSEYYSKELEIYVRKVLQIIPNTMFEKLARIIEMQTKVIKEIPDRLSKDELKVYAQLTERYELAQLTHSISIFAQGMRGMQRTLVGVVCLDPKQLLEDGIRKELVLHISTALNDELIFDPKKPNDNLIIKLKKLGEIMDGYKRSFEYIQDYININGLKMWQEEVTRIVNYSVEQVYNEYLHKKVHPWQSAYQSRYVPIPVYQNQGENFIGRLAEEIIRITDFRSATYQQSALTWYEIKTQNPVFNLDTIVLIAQSIEIAGLVGIDRIIFCMINIALQRIDQNLTRKTTNNIWDSRLDQMIKEFQEVTKKSDKIYQKIANRLRDRLKDHWKDFFNLTMLIGQLQLLRNLIAYYLNKSCKFNAKNLESSLNTLNKSLLLDLKQGNSMPSSELLKNLGQYTTYAGLHQPLKKVYIESKIRTDKLSISITMLLFVVAHLKTINLPQNPANHNKKSQLDGIVMSVGIHTIFQQYHQMVLHSFIKLVGEYFVELSIDDFQKQSTSSDVVLMLNFMDCFTEHSQAARDFYQQSLPEEMLFLYKN